MNEQKKVTLPGSISNIPTTNYGRAYSIVSTWAHQYNADEMKRLLIGRGVDITDINVEEMHRLCRQSLEGLTAPAGSVEVTYEDGTKESLSSSLSMMQPKTPEEQENAWTERKRGLMLAALEHHRDDPAKPEPVPGMKHPLPNRLTGESELARISDYSGRTEFKAGDSIVQRLLASGYQMDDAKIFIPKPEAMRTPHPFDHAFHNYTPEYLREQAIERKTKRLKNQRRRRNAKARRK